VVRLAWFLWGGGIALVVAVVLYSLFVTSLLGGAKGSPSAPDLPDFTLVLYQGQEVVGAEETRFHDLLGRKPLVLNEWASNCPPCRAEMPDIQRVYERYQDRLLFLGLDVGQFLPGFGSQVESRKELEELGITYVAGTLATAQDASSLQVLGLPTTLFITPTGKVHKEWIGILNESKLTELVEELLAASTVS